MHTKKLSIILIQPPCFAITDDHVEQNLGLAYIAAYLKQYNYSVAIVNLTKKHANLLDALCSTIPYADIYGISCYSTNYNYVKTIVSYLRLKYANAHICVGGPHPTAMPKETLQDLGVHSVIVGDGELAFYALIKNLAQEIALPKIIIGTVPSNLDDLPFPHHDPIEHNTFSRTLYGKKTASLVASRGCKFKCLHCNSVVMGGYRKNVKFRSTDNIVAEIRYLKELGYTSLRFNDDNFTAHPDFSNLLENIKREDVIYRIFSPLTSLTQDNCRLLAASGCNFISIGIESMHPDNLRFLGKTSVLHHLENLKYTKQFGITIRASFMVGLPYDTDQSIELAFTKAAHLDFQEFAIYPLIPYPGTRIWQQPAQYNYQIMNKNHNDYLQMGVAKRTCFALQHTDPITGYTFYPDDVKRWYIRAHQILDQKKIHMSESKAAR